MKNKERNREEWLARAAKAMAPWITVVAREIGSPASYPPETLVGVGFCPGAGGHKVAGFCVKAHAHEPEAAKRGQRTIFVDPTMTDPTQVLGTLLHEMIHASLPDDVGHKKPFVDMARGLGLAGKPTSTFVATDSELYTRVTDLAVQLGEYPHVGLVRTARQKKPKPDWAEKMMVIFLSPYGLGYEARVPIMCVAVHGAPLDPQQDPMVVKPSQVYRFRAACEKLGIEVVKEWLPEEEGDEE